MQSAIKRASAREGRGSNREGRQRERESKLAGKSGAKLISHAKYGAEGKEKGTGREAGTSTGQDLEFGAHTKKKSRC